MPALPPRDVARLRHMREAAQKAIAYTVGRDRWILDSDEMRTLAVVRLVEGIVVGCERRAAVRSQIVGTGIRGQHSRPQWLISRQRIFDFVENRADLLRELQY